MTTQISLSFELICLLNWLLNNDQATLNALVKHAIEKGFMEEMGTYENNESQQIPEELYNTIVDFLEFIEQSMVRQLETVHVDTKTKEAILPALQKLETGSLDFKTIWLSMQQTKAKVHKAGPKTSPEPTLASSIKPQDILFEQLLKNWKPHSKETLN